MPEASAGASSPPLEPLESLFEPEYPDTWREMAAGLYLELVLAGVPPSPHDAARLALAQTLRLVDLFGGMQLYIPKGTELRAKATARRVAAEFTGNNHASLARKYRVTTFRIRQMLKEQSRSSRKPPPP